MNFEFSEEQNMLREQAQGFLRDHCSTTVDRRILDGEESYDKAVSYTQLTLTTIYSV